MVLWICPSSKENLVEITLAFPQFMAGTDVSLHSPLVLVLNTPIAKVWQAWMETTI